jgi:hypothetical protein
VGDFKFVSTFQTIFDTVFLTFTSILNPFNNPGSKEVPESTHIALLGASKKEGVKVILLYGR